MTTVNEELDRYFLQFERSQLPKLRRQFAEAVDSTRLQVNDLLTKHAKNDGTISKARINSLVRELEGVEKSTRKKGEQAMRDIANTTAATAAIGANAALIIGIEATILAAIVGVSMASLAAQAGKALAEGMALALGVTFATIKRRTVDYIMNGEIGGMTFVERWWAFSGGLRSDLAKAIRRDALQGRTVQQIMRDVNRVYRDQQWKLDRLVETEALSAYREATALAAQKSKVVKGLRIVDYPGHPHHKTHECYIYAHDDIGIGTGVYPVTETKIIRPHVQCRSSLHFVLTEKAGGNE